MFTGLLKILSQVLMQKPYKPHGMPNQLPVPAPPQPQPPIEPPDPATLILALKVLASFEYGSRPLTQFVKHCADTYLTHENKEVRLEAVKTCCQLLIPALKKVLFDYNALYR